MASASSWPVRRTMTGSPAKAARSCGTSDSAAATKAGRPGRSSRSRPSVSIAAAPAETTTSGVRAIALCTASSAVAATSTR